MGDLETTIGRASAEAATKREGGEGTMNMKQALDLMLAQLEVMRQRLYNSGHTGSDSKFRDLQADIADLAGYPNRATWIQELNLS